MQVAGPDVQIMEVGPRDGLQNIPQFIPTEDKVWLIEALAAAGLRFIEATSFVKPRAVPQMSDSELVGSALRHDQSVVFSALVPNLKGLEKALQAGMPQIGVLAAATESYSRMNTNTTIDGSLERIAGIIATARPKGVSIRGYVSCSVACPYEGPVQPQESARLAERLIEAGCDQVVLGDTVGRGTPASVGRLLDVTLALIPAESVGVHLHDTYGQALANTAEALEKGVRMIDSSVAGLGGSPSAPGAGGNLATEDLLFMLEGLGVATGIDLEEVARIGLEFCSRFDVPHLSRTGRALGEQMGASR